mgnify:CR=1 FL=1
MSQHGNVILRFSDVTYGYTDTRKLMKEASFSVRENAKITLMGQNGAGKSTLFKLILGATENPPEDSLKPEEGSVHIRDASSVAIQTQTMPEEHKDKTVKTFFETAFTEVPFNVDKLIDDALEVVNYPLPKDRLISDLSGGQQARLLLAYALIQKPDILLLDEPINYLDLQSQLLLERFLNRYSGSFLMAAHDRTFLQNTCTHTFEIERGKLTSYKGGVHEYESFKKEQLA